MKEQDKIPVTKMERAAKFMGAGVKMGGNYMKYYAKKLVDPNLSRDTLDQANAADVYESLSALKGSALKVAQMMSMDDSLLPKAYTDRFQMAQYNAPPLSYPLVAKTFRQFFGKTPEAIFDSFSKQAKNAASIGQVHLAEKDGKKLAVKIQYPGVANSVSSDLKMAKPIALRLMNIKGKDLDKYMNEVEERLLEETDYKLELKRSMELTQLCGHIEGLVFPKYYPEWSSERIITMDWIEGIHLSEWYKTNPTQADRDRIGQLLWDFYSFQIHELKMVHADPHPGNFIITPAGELAVIDFGCIKEIPDDFYRNYFELMAPGLSDDKPRLIALMRELDFILADDTPQEQIYFQGVFSKMIELLARPFAQPVFDFGDKAYFAAIHALGDEVSSDKQFRKSNAARGSQHGIYINRTYFGLYNMLHQIGARVKSGLPDGHWLFGNDKIAETTVTGKKQKAA